MSILLSALGSWFAINLAIVAAMHFKPLGARLRRWPGPGRWLLRTLDAVRSDRTADRAMVVGMVVGVIHN